MKKSLFVSIVLFICLSAPFFIEAKVSKKTSQKKRNLSSAFTFQESKQDIELILSKFNAEEPIKVGAILMVDDNTYQIQTLTATGHCNASRLRIDRENKTASFLKKKYKCIKFEEEL